MPSPISAGLAPAPSPSRFPIWKGQPCKTEVSVQANSDEFHTGDTLIIRIMPVYHALLAPPTPITTLAALSAFYFIPPSMQ